MIFSVVEVLTKKIWGEDCAIMSQDMKVKINHILTRGVILIQYYSLQLISKPGELPFGIVAGGLLGAADGRIKRNFICNIVA